MLTSDYYRMLRGGHIEMHTRREARFDHNMLSVCIEISFQISLMPIIRMFN